MCSLSRLLAVQQRPSCGGSDPGGWRHPGVRGLRHGADVGAELRPRGSRRGGDRQPGGSRFPPGAQETIEEGYSYQTKSKV